MGNGIPFLSCEKDPPKNDTPKVTLGLARFLNPAKYCANFVLQKCHPKECLAWRCRQIRGGEKHPKGPSHTVFWYGVRLRSVLLPCSEFTTHSDSQLKKISGGDPRYGGHFWSKTLKFSLALKLKLAKKTPPPTRWVFFQFLLRHRGLTPHHLGPCLWCLCPSNLQNL